MVEYPIQVRWPYKPTVHRCMLSIEYLKWFYYCLFFGFGASADYIRVFYAYAAFSAK